jgi:hypothetical protein
LILVHLNGGLGNQMFQYATARALAKNNKTQVSLDLSEFNIYKLRRFELKRYAVQAQINTNSYLLRLLAKKIKLHKVLRDIHLERNLEYDPKVLAMGKNSYLEGYFQNELYFSNIRDILIKDFTISDGISKYANEVKYKILRKNTAISIHLRRGDYISNRHTNTVHGVCSLNYYKEAIKLMNKKFINARYFIFSDDMKWVKDNLKMDNAVYIEGTKSPHEDMYLMSLCCHNIIANSSFSWWGAWLNNNKNKIVIAPKKWFSDSNLAKQSEDIVCKSWLRL